MKRWLFPLLAVVTAGCMREAPTVRLAQPTRAAVAYVVEDSRGQIVSVPEALEKHVNEALAGRNLQPETLTIGGASRDTTARLMQAVAKAGEARVVVLVELLAVYYAPLNGRYKWTVYAKLSVADAQSPAGAVSQQVEVPAILDLARENEVDAARASSDYVGRRLGELVDDFLANRDTFPKAARPVESAAVELGPVYFVMVNRFANGDRSNDGEVDAADPSAWHGGDLAGVTQHLDELSAMGVRTLWLSPISRCRHETWHGHGAFHGYWTYDLGTVDERFGGEAALVELVGAAHTRGMKVVLDVVLNHVGPEAPLAADKPEWFHHNGGITDWNDPTQLETYDVHGLPDLAVERPEVFDYLLSASLDLARRSGADGFRLDAVKHVPLAFWQRYNAALSRELGPRFILLGELFDGWPEAQASMLARGGFTHLFDFATAFALRDVFCSGQPLARLASVLSSDRGYADPGALVPFVDNHDLPRLASACAGHAAAVPAALATLYALRGTPAISWGTEAGLAGDKEPDNRGDMRFGARPELEATLTRLAAARRPESGAARVLDVDDDRLIFLEGGTLVAVERGAQRPLPARASGCAGSATYVENGADWRVHTWAADCALPAAGARSVRFAISGGGQQVGLVGSGPELGVWGRAGVRQAAGDDAAVVVELPADAVFAYKLVENAPGGLRWEDGPDRWLFVPPGSEPLLVPLSWRSALSRQN